MKISSYKTVNVTQLQSLQVAIFKTSISLSVVMEKYLQLIIWTWKIYVLVTEFRVEQKYKKYISFGFMNKRK